MVIMITFILMGIAFMIGTLVYVKNKNSLQEIKPIDKSNTQKVKKTLKNLWGIDGIANQVVTINRNQHSIIVELESIEYSLLHEQERNNVDAGLTSITRMIKFPIQFLEIKRKIDMEESIENIKINTINSNNAIKEYAKHKRNFDIRMYIDYLGFLKELKFDLKNKKYLFPKNLKEKHDEYSRQIKIKNNEKINKDIKKRYKKLKKNIYSNKKYIIMPADSFISLEDESTQQNHCIRNYAESYAKGNCDIYFMRENNNINKSLVTIEVKNNKIVEKRIKDNDLPNKSQNNFLKRWENEVLKVA